MSLSQGSPQQSVFCSWQAVEIWGTGWGTDRRSSIICRLVSDSCSMLLLIDNYDSFTYNLFHYLGELGADVRVERNDALSADQVLALKPQGIVLSPGPCTPNEAGICLELIEKANGRVPILGVCLGHQAIGQAYGAKVVRAPE